MGGGGGGGGGDLSGVVVCFFCFFLSLPHPVNKIFQNFFYSVVDGITRRRSTTQDTCNINKRVVMKGYEVFLDVVFSSTIKSNVYVSV